MRRAFLIPSLIVFTGCIVNRGPVPGPDKQASGEVMGAMTGAGAGAITGAQVGAGTGPGVAIGAGFGALAGLVSGAQLDASEEVALKRQADVDQLRETAWAQEVLADYHKRRMELHPDREIFPADLFFSADTDCLNQEGRALVREYMMLVAGREPWSRLLVVASSVTGKGPNEYGEHLNRKRAESIADELIKQGFEPRRIRTKGLLVKNLPVKDPLDSPRRYGQTIEFISLDR